MTFLNCLKISLRSARGTVLRNYADAETTALKLRRKWELGLQPIHAYCHVKAMVAI